MAAVSVLQTVEQRSAVHKSFVNLFIPYSTNPSKAQRSFTMGTEQKVAVITGASQGIGAALVKAYRDRNYRVVAISRSIKPSDDDAILAVPATSLIEKPPSVRSPKA